jgi:exonuclease 3'-5' domain-containing protein 2
MTACAMDQRAASPRGRENLWYPSHGIIFTPAQAAVVYPRLDLSGLSDYGQQGASPSSALARSRTAPLIGSTRPGAMELPISRCNRRAAYSTDCRVSSETPAETSSDTAEVDGKLGSNRSGAEAANDLDETDEPPFTPLQFKIPEEIFRNAKLAVPGSPESFWSYSMYRGPGEGNLNDSKVKVHYCTSKHTTERVCQYFLQEKALGFDLEWWPNATKNSGAKRNVSLIQIASERRIALFHVALYKKEDDLLAPSLKKIMEDPDIKKLGVCVKADCTRLKTFIGSEPRGIFELSHLYKLVKYSTTGAVQHVNKRVVSLAKQTEEYLKLPLFKGDVRSSDWTQPLTLDQIICELQ